MKLTNITHQLRDFAHDELLALANWCQSEATARDPRRLAEIFAHEKWLENRRMEEEAYELKLNFPETFTMRSLVTSRATRFNTSLSTCE